MTDKVTKIVRSKNMSRIRGENTKQEVKVRKWLFKEGFRYNKNVKKLPGTPDIVLKKYKTVIFINGCFWHRHINCKYSTTPKTNTDFWIKKFQKNVANDLRNQNLLMTLGWHVITLWECELKEDFEKIMKEVELTLMENK